MNDPHNEPGPTTDERIQVWSAHHLVSALVTLVLGFIALAWWAFHN